MNVWRTLKSRSLFSAALTAAVAAVPLGKPAPAPAGPVASQARRAVLDQKLPEVKFDNVALKDAIDFFRDVTGANIHVNWRAIETAGVGQDTNVQMHLREVSLRKALNLLLSDAGAGVALTYYVDQGVIEVTTRELADKDMFTRVYPVQDLIVEVPDFTDAPDLSLLMQQAGQSGQGGGSGGGGGGGGYGGGGGGGAGGGQQLFGNQGNGQNEEKTKTRQERADDLVALIRETVYPDIWRENGGPASIRYYSGNLVVTAPRSVHEALGGYVE